MATMSMPMVAQPPATGGAATGSIVGHTAPVTSHEHQHMSMQQPPHHNIQQITMQNHAVHQTNQNPAASMHHHQQQINHQQPSQHHMQQQSYQTQNMPPQQQAYHMQQQQPQQTQPIQQQQVTYQHKQQSQQNQYQHQPQHYHQHNHVQQVHQQSYTTTNVTATTTAVVNSSPPPAQQPPPQQQQQQQHHHQMTILSSEPSSPPPPAQSKVSTEVVSLSSDVSAELQDDGDNSTGSSAATGSGAGSFMANTKEKTPMCLINELSRFNKIQPQYRLVDESGPAHMKTFTVLLQLGQDDLAEEYQASGPSIKKAQHAAAGLALEKTNFKHPPHKTKRSSITPTVELNALAMKRGEPAHYTFLEPPRPVPYIPPGYYDKGVPYGQRFGGYGRHPPFPPMFYVQLRVGPREYFGEGYTAQAAKHNSASKALREIRDLPMPEHVNQGETQSLTDLDPDADLKSPISLVHEVALKHGFGVQFEVLKEAGPPHMRVFITQCIVGDTITEGEGNSKKLSKKRAADKMLEELKHLPPLPPATFLRIKKKPNAPKKKSRNLIKVSEDPKGSGSGDYGQGINPISRLIQIQQAKKEKEPVFTLLAERGVPRRREFVMQVKVGSHVCTGSGPNKKLAKRAAADALLQLLGYSRPQPQPEKSSIKHQQNNTTIDDRGRKVTFVEEMGGLHVPPPVDKQQGGGMQLQMSDGMVGAGRQLVPGLLLMSDGTTALPYTQPATAQQQAAQQQQQQRPVDGGMVNVQTTNYS
jgi:double-stranded RNA-binding protein Staufen